MASFLEELLNNMKTAPHVGIPPVTNPKVPTKVERDVAEFKVRQKAMPNFKFGTGTVLQQIKEHTEKHPHIGPTCPDPAFSNTWETSYGDIDFYEAQYQQYRKSIKASRNKKGDVQ